MTLLLNIDVPDVARATTFYTEAFGLTIGRRFGTDFVELLGWPAPVYLLTKQAGTLGAAMMQRFAELKWAARDATPGSRVVNFTRSGEKQFAALFGNGKD